ncbi:MAG: FAD-dependent oxidoreductase [Advenella sp.]|nr:FAD-dependent oxidoreductase [Advenella sp.]
MTAGRIIIAGAGQAGGWAARTLRDKGYTGNIVLVGVEAHPPYERPPLSKEILQGACTSDTLAILDDESLKTLDIDIRLNTEVIEIDRQAHSVMLGNGQQLAYDKLILCTGGRARHLPISGIEHERVFKLRTLDDALNLKKALTDEAGHVLVIGGGWIGLEVASSARQMGCEVTVAEYADRLCQRSVAPDISDMLFDLHISQGVKVQLETQVLEVNPTEKGLLVSLSNGQALLCTYIVVAAGLIANDELAKKAGLDCNNGVFVDGQCRTSDPDIYAAGDVAITRTLPAGTQMRLESWQNAQDQGIAAAMSILNTGKDYYPIPLLWSEQFDWRIQIFGHVNGNVRLALRQLASDGSLHFYLNEDDMIVGVIGVNAGRDFRFARQLVERAAKILPADLVDAGKSLKQLSDSVAVTL